MLKFLILKPLVSSSKPHILLENKKLTAKELVVFEVSEDTLDKLGDIFLKEILVWRLVLLQLCLDTK